MLCLLVLQLMQLLVVRDSQGLYELHFSALITKVDSLCITAVKLVAFRYLSSTLM